MERIRIDAALPIVAVTVHEDRARVVRRGRVALPAGVGVIVVAVAPVAVDRSLAARLSGSGAAKALDRRVVRERLAPGDDRRATAAIEARLRALDAEIAALNADRDAARKTLGLLAATVEHTLADAQVDAANGRTDAAVWTDALRRLGAAESASAQRAARTEHALDRLARERADLHAQQAARAAAGGDLVARAEVVVETAAAGDHEVEISYQVPNACWRPQHTARLEDGRVAWQAEACVWQATSEDWRGASIQLSTARPSLGAEAPRLVEDRLRLQPRERAIVVEARDRAVEDTGPAGRPADEMPGVDDGGETRLLQAAGAVDVPGDGLPHRVPLFAFAAPAEVSLEVRAELAAAAILRSVLTNAAPQPLLAGPVDLLRGGGLAGRASIGFVAPGAGFELGWGPDAALRVAREERSREEQPGMLSSKRSTLHEVDLALSNLADAPRRVQVVERIPVSEIPQVEIELDATATTPRAQPDRDGFCRWTVELPPRANATVRLRWRLRRSGEVVGV